MYTQVPTVSITLQKDSGYTSHTVDPIRDSRVDVLYRRVLNQEMTATEAYEVFTKAVAWLRDIFSSVEVHPSYLGGSVDENNEVTIYEISI